MTQRKIEVLHEVKGVINHVRINFLLFIFFFFLRQYLLPETPLFLNNYGPEVSFLRTNWDYLL